MALPFKLMENFRVRYFGSSHNVNGIGKYLPPASPVETLDPAIVPRCFITHVSKTRAEDSVTPTCQPEGCYSSKPFVESGKDLSDGNGDQIVHESPLVKKKRRDLSKKRGGSVKKRKTPDPTRM